MMRRSFQLSGSYDVIKDVTDLESKCPFIFSRNLKSNILKLRDYVCLIFTVEIHKIDVTPRACF